MNNIGLKRIYDDLIEEFISNNKGIIGSDNNLVNRFHDGTLQRNSTAEIYVPSCIQNMDSMDCVAIR